MAPPPSTGVKAVLAEAVGELLEKQGPFGAQFDW
jgi:hypothetical protein